MSEGRAAYHQANQARAEAEAQRLWAQREVLQGRWHAWVALQLYQLTPAPYASMVRRALQQRRDAAGE